MGFAMVVAWQCNVLGVTADWWCWFLLSQFLSLSHFATDAFEGGMDWTRKFG